MSKNCGNCDWYRHTMEWNELIEMHRTVRKAETQKRASRVCVHPDSPFYGQRRRINNVGCDSFHDFFWRWDNDGQKPVEQQIAFVTKYRKEFHGLEPLTGIIAGGWNACY